MTDRIVSDLLRRVAQLERDARGIPITHGGGGGGSAPYIVANLAELNAITASDGDRGITRDSRQEYFYLDDQWVHSTAVVGGSGGLGVIVAANLAALQAIDAAEGRLGMIQDTGDLYLRWRRFGIMVWHKVYISYWG